MLGNHSSDTDQIDSAQRELPLPSPVPLLSSEALGWCGIVVEKRHHPANEFTYPGFDHHLISIHVGPPIELEQTYGKRTHRAHVHEGCVSLLSAGYDSTWRHQDDAHFINIQLDASFVTSVAERSNTPNSDNVELIDLFSSPDRQIQQLGSLLVDELTIQSATGRLYAESLTTALVVHLITHYAVFPAALSASHARLSQWELQHVFEYINDCLRHDISLTKLADLVDLSPNYFISQFRRAVGMSPHQYIIRQRVDRARTLLIESTKPVAEIATEVGFFDQSHLTRHMRRLHGITPGALRHQQRSNVPKKS
ncbi:MAG: AraC family transcriptional regulator [Chloroflexota bacterium]